MATVNIVEKIKVIQEQAKAIDTACVTLLANPNLSEVVQFANMLEAFATGQPKPVGKAPGEKRKRRTPAEIEADRLKAEGGK